MMSSLTELAFSQATIFSQSFSRNVQLPTWTSDRKATLDGVSEGSQWLFFGMSGR